MTFLFAHYTPYYSKQGFSKTRINLCGAIGSPNDRARIVCRRGDASLEGETLYCRIVSHSAYGLRTCIGEKSLTAAESGDGVPLAVECACVGVCSAAHRCPCACEGDVACKQTKGIGVEVFLRLHHSRCRQTP